MAKSIVRALAVLFLIVAHTIATITVANQHITSNADLNQSFVAWNCTIDANFDIMQPNVHVFLEHCYFRGVITVSITTVTNVHIVFNHTDVVVPVDRLVVLTAGAAAVLDDFSVSVVNQSSVTAAECYPGLIAAHPNVLLQSYAAFVFRDSIIEMTTTIQRLTPDNVGPFLLYIQFHQTTSASEAGFGALTVVVDNCSISALQTATGATARFGVLNIDALTNVSRVSVTITTSQFIVHSANAIPTANDVIQSATGGSVDVEVVWIQSQLNACLLYLDLFVDQSTFQVSSSFQSFALWIHNAKITSGSIVISNSRLQSRTLGALNLLIGQRTVGFLHCVTSDLNHLPVVLTNVSLQSEVQLGLAGQGASVKAAALNTIDVSLFAVQNLTSVDIVMTRCSSEVTSIAVPGAYSSSIATVIQSYIFTLLSLRSNGAMMDSSIAVADSVLITRLGPACPVYRNAYLFSPQSGVPTVVNSVVLSTSIQVVQVLASVTGFQVSVSGCMLVTNTTSLTRDCVPDTTAYFSPDVVEARFVGHVGFQSVKGLLLRQLREIVQSAHPNAALSFTANVVLGNVNLIPAEYVGDTQLEQVDLYVNTTLGSHSITVDDGGGRPQESDHSLSLAVTFFYDVQIKSMALVLTVSTDDEGCLTTQALDVSGTSANASTIALAVAISLGNLSSGDNSPSSARTSPTCTHLPLWWWREGSKWSDCKLSLKNTALAFRSVPPADASATTAPPLVNLSADVVLSNGTEWAFNDVQLTGFSRVFSLRNTPSDPRGSWSNNTRLLLNGCANTWEGVAMDTALTEKSLLGGGWLGPTLKANNPWCRPNVTQPRYTPSSAEKGVALGALVALAVQPPLSAIALQRAFGLRMICGDGAMTTTLDWTASPTQVTIGNEYGSGMRGALVGNVAIIWGGCSVVVLMFVWWKKWKATKSVNADWSSVLAQCTVPGWCSIYLAPLLQPVVTAAVTIFASMPYGNPELGAGDVAGAICASAVVLVLVAWAAVVMLHPKCLRHAVEAIPSYHVSAPLRRRATLWKRLHWWLCAPSATWRVTRSRRRDLTRRQATLLFNMYGPLFEGNTGRRFYWVLVDTGISLVMGVLGGLMPEEQSQCDAVLWISAAILCVVFLASVAASPILNTRLENGTYLAVNGVSAVVAICTAQGVDPENLWDLSVLCASIAIASSAVSVASWVSDQDERSVGKPGVGNRSDLGRLLNGNASSSSMKKMSPQSVLETLVTNICETKRLERHGSEQHPAFQPAASPPRRTGQRSPMRRTS